VEEEQAHEKKVQKGVLKQTIIKEVLEEPEGEAKKAAEAAIQPPEAEPAVVRQFQPTRVSKKRGRPVKEKKVPSTLPPKASKRHLKIEEVVTVGDLAHRMGIKAADVIKKLIEMGMPSTLTSSSTPKRRGSWRRSTASRWRTWPPRWRASSTRRRTGRRISGPGPP
jgi:translation initiation factor IF-2